MLTIKILGYRGPQRYAVRRTVEAARQALLPRYPELALDITEIKDTAEIDKFTNVLILPSLVINGKLVCSGRFPSREEVIGWLREAIEFSSNR